MKNELMVRTSLGMGLLLLHWARSLSTSALVLCVCSTARICTLPVAVSSTPERVSVAEIPAGRRCWRPRTYSQLTLQHVDPGSAVMIADYNTIDMLFHISQKPLSGADVRNFVIMRSRSMVMKIKFIPARTYHNSSFSRVFLKSLTIKAFRLSVLT